MYRYSLNTIFTAVGDYQASVTHTLAYQLFQKTLTQIGSHYKPQDHLVQCFISYAWASADALPNSAEKAHEAYAEKIALDLKTAGFTVLFDKWHDRAGKDINDFVEKILDESTHFILPLGTELYLKKYQKRSELLKDKNHVVRAEGKLLNYLVTFNDQHSERVIPLLLEGTAEQSLPPLLRPKIPVFLTVDYFEGMFKLTRDLYKIDQQDQEFRQIITHFTEQLQVIEQTVTNEIQIDYEINLQNQTKDNAISTQKEVNAVLAKVLTILPPLQKINNENLSINSSKYFNLTNLPSENPEFIGREELLKNINQGWRVENIAIQTLTQANGDKPSKYGKHTQQTLAGLGGIGKTQSALAYAHAQNNLPKAERPYFIRWMNAEGTQTNNSLRQFAKQLDIKLIELSHEMMLVALYQQLKVIPRWLLVFDNVDTYEAIKPYLPPADCRKPGQHVLITSRNQAWPSQLIKMIEVDIFTPEEALIYFAQFFPELDNLSNISLKQVAALLAEELGYLPLALSHAVAYMKKKKLGIELYLKRYREAGLAVLKEHPQDEVLPYPHTVLTTWAMAMEQLALECPEATILLNQTAYLAPILKRFNLHSWLKLFETEASLDRAIEGLNQYSLVSIRQIDHEDSLVFHRLVLAVTRERQPTTEQKKYYQQAVERVWQEIKVNDTDWNNPEAWPKMVKFLEHTMSLLTPNWALDWLNKAVWQLAYRVGLYFLAQGSFTQAMNYMQQGLSLVKSQYNETNAQEDIAFMLHEVGVILKSQGKWMEAQLYYEESLKIKYQIYGYNIAHPNIAGTLHGLGRVLQGQGNLTEAQLFYEKSLYMYYQLYGEESIHPYIAGTLNGLARVLQGQTDWVAAQNYYEQALAMYREIYKDGLHPYITGVQQELGQVLESRGLIAEAQMYYEQSLTTDYLIYGHEAENPNIAAKLHNLGGIFYKQEQFEKAEKYFLHALSMRQASLGESHLDTEKTQSCLSDTKAKLHSSISEQGFFAHNATLPSLQNNKRKSTLKKCTVM